MMFSLTVALASAATMTSAYKTYTPGHANKNSTTFTCAHTGHAAYCAGGDNIMTCKNGTAYAESCNDRLYNKAPATINGLATCWESSHHAGDAACAKAGVVYPALDSGVHHDDEAPFAIPRWNIVNTTTTNQTYQGASATGTGAGGSNDTWSSVLQSPVGTVHATSSTDGASTRGPQPTSSTVNTGHSAHGGNYETSAVTVTVAATTIVVTECGNSIAAAYDTTSALRSSTAISSRSALSSSTAISSMSGLSSSKVISSMSGLSSSTATSSVSLPHAVAVTSPVASPVAMASPTSTSTRSAYPFAPVSVVSPSAGWGTASAPASAVSAPTGWYATGWSASPLAASVTPVATSPLEFTGAATRSQQSLGVAIGAVVAAFALL